MGLELVWFVDVRDALWRYTETAGAIGNPTWRAKYEKILDRLAKDLEASARQRTVDGAFRINQAIGLLSDARQTPELLAALRSKLSRPNVFVRVKSEVVGAGIAGPIDEVATIEDCILGTSIHGTGRTVGQTTVALVPSSDRGVVDVNHVATNTSQNVGYNGPVCIQTCGVTGLSACKRVWINADGWFDQPATACAEVHTTIQSICANRQIVENIAWRRAGKQKGEAESIASQHARQRVSERVRPAGRRHAQAIERVV